MNQLITEVFVEQPLASPGSDNYIEFGVQAHFTQSFKSQMTSYLAQETPAKRLSHYVK